MNKALQDKTSKIKEILLKYKVEKAYSFGSFASASVIKSIDSEIFNSFANHLDYKTYGNNYFNLIEKL
jgi:predicted nucleotidyltransferase